MTTFGKFLMFAGVGALTGGVGWAFAAPIAGFIGTTGVLGAASTGTAIASLSGAAATNASLAILGGGALSVGGAGIAGGTAVIAGSSAALGVGGAYSVIS